MNHWQLSALITRCVAAAMLSASVFISLSTCDAKDSVFPDIASIQTLFERFETAINQRDLESLSGLLTDSDPVWKQSTLDQYSQFWKSSANFSYTIEVGYPEEVGSKIEIPALRIIAVHESGETKSDVSMRRISIEAAEGSPWKLGREQPDETARGLRTDLDLQLDAKNSRIDLRAAISIELLKPNVSHVLFTLNPGLVVRSVAQHDGTPLHHRRIDRFLIIDIKGDIKSGSPFDLFIECSGDFEFNDGVYSASQGFLGEPVSFATWTMDWYPVLADNCSQTCGKLTFDVPAGITVTSTGRLLSEHNYGRRTRRVFDVLTPVHYSFAAGEYTERSHKKNNQEFSVCLLERDRGHSREFLSTVTRIVQYLSSLYGSFPYTELKIVEIPGNMLGAIKGSSEQGMIFVPETMIEGDYFNLALISHEIGHAWWGNAIRSRDGRAIDEGIAQLSALLCIEKFQGESEMRAFLRSGFPGFPQSAQYYFLVTADRPGRDFILSDPKYAYTCEMHSIAETKAAFVYLMLRDYIGERAFFSGLKQIVKEYSGASVGLNDLNRIWSQHSALDLTGFFDQWFSRTGAPQFQMTWSAVRARESWVVTCNVEQLRETYEVRAEIEIQGEEESMRRPFSISTSPAVVQFTTSFEPLNAIFDPDYRVFRWTPQHVENMALGTALLLQAEHREMEAVASYEDFLETNPAHSFGHLYYGNLLFLMQQYDLAKTHYQLAIDHADNDPEFMPFTSFALLKIGQSNEAQLRIKEAVETYEEIFKRRDIAGSHQLARNSLRELFGRNDPTVIEKGTPDLRSLWRQVYHFGQ